MDTRALLDDKNLPKDQRELTASVSRVAAARRLPVYLVGGFVRDLLLGLTPDDFDFVVEGDAPALARALARELGGEAAVHAPFGTATWRRPDGAPIDFATARTETYAQPAALPTVAPSTIAADLQRRDFSINAMAVRVDGEHRGELLDPFGGQADLAAHAVRVLHPASFRDDPTRLFRAVRYEQRLGFHLALETLALIPGARESLAALTGDRARHEFELAFREANTTVMLTRLAELDILQHIHPALQWGVRQADLAAAIRDLPLAEWKLTAPLEPEALYWSLMLMSASPAEAAAALARLNVNRAVSNAVLAAHRTPIEGTRPSAVVAVLDGQSELALVAAYLLKPELRPALHEYLARWRFVTAETTGDDLIRLGLTPGPDFKRILWALRAARLDGEVRDEAGERELVKQLAGTH